MLLAFSAFCVASLLMPCWNFHGFEIPRIGTQEVDFGKVSNYLQGSRKLKISPNWRGVIPDWLG